MGMSPAAVATLNDKTRPEVVASWSGSKYDPIANRWYGRFYEHTKFGRLDTEHDHVYDLQTDDLLAYAAIKYGKKNGWIWDTDYKKAWQPSCISGCPSDFGDKTW